MYADQSDQDRQDEIERKALLMQMQDPADVPPPNPADAHTMDTGGSTTLPVPDVPPPTGEKSAPTSPFSSHHGTVSGYLQAAAQNYAPTVQGAKNEQAAKQLAEEYIRSLVPEIEARGGKVGDIKNEKVMIDGKWVDLYRDIGGASEAQYLVDDGTGGGGAADSALPALMDPNATSVPGSSLPTDQSTYAELMRRIQEILGPEATDRQALLAQMKA